MKRCAALCLLLCLSVTGLAESRAAPYPPEKLKEMSTLVFTGTVMEVETVEKYEVTFPVRARAGKVVKGALKTPELSFKHKSPGRCVILEKEFNTPEVGQEGTFYIQDQAGTLTLIGYIKKAEPAPEAGSSPAPLPDQRTVLALDGSAKMILKERRAELYRIGDDRKDDLIWAGNLTNIPGKFFVASGGEFFVTVGTWASAGEDPLIFYDSGGRVIKRYRDAGKELLRPEELSKVERVMVSIDWSPGAHLHFTANGQYFLVWFPWGRMMVFDSATGKQTDPDPLRRFAGHDQRSVVLQTARLLSDSKEPSDRIAAARFAGWLGGKAVLPILRNLMQDPHYVDGFWRKVEDRQNRFGDNYFRTHTRRYPVRRAAAEEMHIQVGQAEAVIEEVVAK